jgi:hypothetical protein
LFTFRYKLTANGVRIRKLPFDINKVEAT